MPTNYVYDPQRYTQDEKNEGQRKINYALTEADELIVDILKLVRDAIQAPPGQAHTYVPQINAAIDKATKYIDHIAGIRPPGCDDTWTPPPDPPPPNG